MLNKLLEVLRVQPVNADVVIPQRDVIEHDHQILVGIWRDSVSRQFRSHISRSVTLQIDAYHPLSQSPLSATAAYPNPIVIQVGAASASSSKAESPCQ